MAKFTKPKFNYAADDVWAAACQAQRLNQSYIKANDVQPEQENATKSRANRLIMDDLLADTSLITDADREQGAKVRKYFQALTFKVLKGIKLNDFLNTAMVIANREVIETGYDVAVIASLPSSYERSTERDAIKQRIEWAQGGFVSTVGAKTKQTVEVVKQIWSQTWNTYYITGINDKDQVLFFAYRNNIEIGSTITVEGTVKCHRDNSTQLNRVKIVA